MREVEAESREYMKTAKALDMRVIVVMITVALMLMLQEYVGMSRESHIIVSLLDKIGLDSLSDQFNTAMTTSPNIRINQLTYWAAGCFITYFIIPAMVIKFVFREKLRDYGLQFKGAFSDYWIYLFMFAVVGPLVFIVSNDPHFMQTYPFYNLHPGEKIMPHMTSNFPFVYLPHLLRWELLYFTQFFALEFFFRGFMIHGTRHRLGYYSVLAMMVPYCMIHFGKPMPETLGAIIAGIALGSLSLKTRSIWLGVAIHSSVALSMDFVSLWRKGLLF